MQREHEFPPSGESPRESLGERGEELGERAGEAAERVRERADEAMERVRERGHEARQQAAGRVEEAGSRMRERGLEMEREGGVKGKVGQAAHRGGDTLEHGAEYLRSHDLSEMRDDLTEKIRERPLLCVGAAIGAGYLLGRIFRG